MGKWYSEKQKILSTLESTYTEKLKLEEPAKYWKERGNNLQNQWNISLWILIILIIFIGFCLYFLLWNTPEAIYQSFLSNDKSAAIRWSIIFLMFISFVVYWIKSLAKFMFSCFHLARDSQEKHTLTYFYLSLLKDSNVDKEEKQLIMQSLFARAETWLLKEDSSPSMPNDLVSKLLQK